MIVLQLSAGQGPVECARAVYQAKIKLTQEAQAHQVDVVVLEAEEGPVTETYNSIILGLVGDRARELAKKWSGSLLWISPSADRIIKRKNWFFSGAIWVNPAPIPQSAIRFEPTRSSGPGGQHVNRTQSAIRATHIASGLTVKVQSQRDQHANKKIAIEWIAHRLSQHLLGQKADLKARQRLQHHQLERGNPTRTFVGAGFAEKPVVIAPVPRLG